MTTSKELKTQLMERYTPSQEIAPTHWRPEIVTFGEIRVAFQGFGDYYMPTRRYVNEEQIAANDPTWVGLKLLGVGGNYLYDPNVDLLSHDTQMRQARQVADLAETVIRENKWADGVDLLTIGSSSTSREAMEAAIDTLRERGIKIDQTKQYYLLCASASAALADTLRDKNTKGIRAVHVGVEGLSGDIFEQGSGVVQQALFGNGVGVIAYRPHRDIDYLHGQTVLVRDTGTIHIPHIYRLPSESERLEELPPGYRIKEGEGSLTDIVAVTKGGIYLLPPRSSDGRAHINPKINVSLFSREAPPLYMETFRDYLEMLKQGKEVNPTLMHQPSLAVWLSVAMKIWEECDRRGIPFEPARDMPWMMNELDSGNTSSATIIRALLEMIKQNKLKPGLRTPVVGLGIGAVIGLDEIVLSA